MNGIYDNITHVNFRGFKIYNHESKITTIKDKDSWTYSQLQREFKTGFNAVKLLVEYAQEKGVLGEGVVNGHGSKFEVIKNNKYNP